MNKQLKSKTNVAMVIGAGIISILPQLGVQIPADAAAGIMAILGMVMRQFTSTSIKDK